MSRLRERLAAADEPTLAQARAGVAAAGDEATPVLAAGCDWQVTWRCPVCLWSFRVVYLPLAQLWGHLETEHGLTHNEATGKWTQACYSARNSAREDPPT